MTNTLRRLSILAALALLTFAPGAWASDVAVDLQEESAREYFSLKQQLAEGMRPNVAQTARNEQATLFESDRDPLDIVVRRTSALLEELQSSCDEGALTQVEANWADFLKRYERERRRARNRRRASGAL